MIRSSDRTPAPVLGTNALWTAPHLHDLGAPLAAELLQGVEGSFSHLAAQRRYAGRPGGAWLVGHDSFRGAADAVVSGDR